MIGRGCWGWWWWGVGGVIKEVANNVLINGDAIRLMTRFGFH